MSLTQNIEKAFPSEAANYERFMSDHAKKLETIFPCLLNAYHKISSYFRAHMIKALPYVATKKSVMDPE